MGLFLGNKRKKLTVFSVYPLSRFQQLFLTRNLLHMACLYLPELAKMRR